MHTAQCARCALRLGMGVEANERVDSNKSQRTRHMNDSVQTEAGRGWTYFEVSEEECSVIVHGSHRYFLLQITEDRAAFVSDTCPHRGGPLHMGAWDSSCAKIRCPWHKLSWSPQALGTRMVPAIRRGQRWSLVLPQVEAQPYPLRRKVVGPNGDSPAARGRGALSVNAALATLE
jgi:nitrite reductase/ring-hydroxylating ferredoxin subunit